MTNRIFISNNCDLRFYYESDNNLINLIDDLNIDSCTTDDVNRIVLFIKSKTVSNMFCDIMKTFLRIFSQVNKIKIIFYHNLGKSDLYAKYLSDIFTDTDNIQLSINMVNCYAKLCTIRKFLSILKTDTLNIKARLNQINNLATVINDNNNIKYFSVTTYKLDKLFEQQVVPLLRINKIKINCFEDGYVDKVIQMIHHSKFLSEIIIISSTTAANYKYLHFDSLNPIINCVNRNRSIKKICVDTYLSSDEEIEYLCDSLIYSPITHFELVCDSNLKNENVVNKLCNFIRNSKTIESIVLKRVYSIDIFIKLMDALSVNSSIISIYLHLWITQFDQYQIDQMCTVVDKSLAENYTLINFVVEISNNTNATKINDIDVTVRNRDLFELSRFVKTKAVDIKI